MPCGTQVITTERLSEDLARSLIPKNYCVEDCNYLLDYYRLTADNRLLYGGGVVYGARDPDDVERLVVPKMLKTFPQLKGVKIDYRWTGNFLLTCRVCRSLVASIPTSITCRATAATASPVPTSPGV